MRPLRMLGWLGAAAVLAAAAWGLHRVADPVHRIPGLEGPEPTALPVPPPSADPTAYARGGASRLAVYITDPDAPWLSLALGLRTIGVPFTITADAQEAAKHAVVLAYPTISGRTVPAAASQALRAQVANGGTLIAFEVLGAGLDDVFGQRPPPPAVPREQLTWSDEAVAQWQFSEAEERVLPLGRPAVNGYALEPAGAEVLARYGDGAPALLRNAFGKGRAYTLGFDLGAYVASAQQGRRTSGRNFINAYEPGMDVLLRWLRAVYREGAPQAVTLGTVPQGRPLAVVLTHDVDFSKSIHNALDYARSEAAQQVHATYYVQAKYVRDWNDDRFFDADGERLTRQVQDLGGELASHSVAHSPVFSKLPLGTGSERYPDYAPYVESKQKTRDASILGELRISRLLLEHASGGKPIDGFRPGHLEYPFALPQALQATGYRTSSSLAAGVAQSHLPYQLTYNRDGRALVPVHEFPITLEDELVRPMDTALLPAALEVTRKLARYGGVCVVLIHPNVLDDKLRFQQQFVTAMQGRQAWIGPLGDYARWWRARDAVEVDVVPAANGQPVLKLRAGEAIAQLPLQLPAGWRLAGGKAPVVDLPAGDTELALEPVP